MPLRSAAALSGVAAAALVAALLPACSSAAGQEPAGAASQQAPASSAPSDGSTSSVRPTPQPEPVTLTSNVKDGAKGVKVDTLVSVKASFGTLTKVTLRYEGFDRRGRPVQGGVSGALSKDRTSWTATERLDPAASYALLMAGKNAQNQVTKTSVSFRTHNLTLDQQTFPSIYPFPGAKVGVGMPAILTFDVPVKNRAEFEKNLHVTATPAQPGTWHWFSNKEVHYRPKSYWRPGTKVKVWANLNGVNAGGGIYGQESKSTSFTVSRSLITKINLDTYRAAVYRNGRRIRTIPISAGRSGWETRSGIKLIMNKEYTHRMTDEMIGARGENYDLNVRYAMRITWSGEFLHAAPWNTGNFGRRHASHGCVGMSTGNAAWLFHQVQIGDPVVTVGSRRRVEDGNGYSDWNLSYAEYAKGSALS
jgi:lipoprotein-anchoring transpeptidase ErfK/SrfK